MKKIVILLLLSCFTYESKSIEWRNRAIAQASTMTYYNLEREARRQITGYHQGTQEIMKEGYTHAFNIRKQRKELVEKDPLDKVFQCIKDIDPSHDLDALNVIYLKRKSEQDDVLISQMPSLLSKIEEMSKEIKSLKELQQQQIGEMSKEIKSLKEQNTELQQNQDNLVEALLLLRRRK